MMNRQDTEDAKKVQEPSETTDRLAHNVIGAAIEVHRALGPGYLESVYESALAVELDHRGIAYQQQHPFSLSYRDQNIGQGRIDLLVERAIIIELKTVDQIAPIHRAQVISYLKALDCQLGLLINFNVPYSRTASNVSFTLWTDFSSWRPQRLGGSPLPPCTNLPSS